MFYIAEHAGPSVCSAFSVSERGESDEIRCSSYNHTTGYIEVEADSEFEAKEKVEDAVSVMQVSYYLYNIKAI